MLAVERQYLNLLEIYLIRYLFLDFEFDFSSCNLLEIMDNILPYYDPGGIMDYNSQVLQSQRSSK